MKSKGWPLLSSNTRLEVGAAITPASGCSGSEITLHE